MARITIPRVTDCLLLAALLALPALAQEADCLSCHRALTEKKNVHAALQAGCTACHAELDAGVVPHKQRGKLAKGLTAEPPELCQQCHDRRLFEGRYAHAPAAAGLCTTCHDPHASDHPALTRKAGAATCLDCHSDITSKPHVLAGFSRRGHPLGDEPKSAAARDPLREGKLFYCGSCHEPHRANFPRLTRFDPKPMSSFCQTCHRV